MSFDRGNTASTITEPFLYVGDDEVHMGGPGSASGGAATGTQRARTAPVRDENQDREIFDRGVQDGWTRAKTDFDQQLAASRTTISAALAEFRTQREHYFSRVESEIVQLSLSIARKILHREVQMDPLLLAGLVHVALEKLESGTRVRLRANPADIHYWSEYFARAESFQPAPELIGDPQQKPGECFLEGDMGSTQVSIDTQLKEIEQGFFDLLEQRPRT